MSTTPTLTLDPVDRPLRCRCGHVPASHTTLCVVDACGCRRGYRHAHRASQRPVISSYVQASGDRRWSVRRTRGERVGLGFASFDEALIYVRLGCPPMGSTVYQAWRSACS